MSNTDDRAKSIFLDALEIPDADQRAAYVRSQCGDDSQLHHAVEHLIGQHEQMGRFLQTGRQENVADGDQPAVPDSGTRHCPQCGTELPADAPDGLCAQCQAAHELPTRPPRNTSDEQPVHRGPFAAPSPEELDRRLPQLEVIEMIGQGGMGAVYKARQPGLDRMVAVKILPGDPEQDPTFAERFTREARALAKLNHSNIVSVYDFGQSDGLYYFVMEFVDGVNIRQLIRSGECRPEEALRIVPQICEALQFAHDEGIVHRDIKPENILIDKRGHVKIADFGIAKLLHPSDPAASHVGRSESAAPEYTLTGPWQVIGTANYMAPEQLTDPLHVDHRADIYALGVVFYEMLTNELPRGRFAPPSQKVQVDVRLDEVVLRSLESEPGRRYQRASEVKTDITTITSERPPQPIGQSSPAIGQRPADSSALEQVKGPATGLLVTGILNWIGIPAVTAILILTALHQDLPIPDPQRVLPVIALILFIASGLMIFGALKMRKLEAYGAAITASILAMIVNPGSLIGFPIGIWALVVLTRREVKAAFTAGASDPELPRDNRQSDDSYAERRSVQVPADALIVVGSLALLTAIGISLWLWLAALPPELRSHQLSMTYRALRGIAVAYVFYSVFIIAAAVLMRRLQARLFVLLSVSLIGIAIPAVLALNVIMELEHIPEWPVGIPMWLGMPISAWAGTVVLRRDVREAFERRIKNASDVKAAIELIGQTGEVVPAVESGSGPDEPGHDQPSWAEKSPSGVKTDVESISRGVQAVPAPAPPKRLSEADTQAVRDRVRTPAISLTILSGLLILFAVLIGLAAIGVSIWYGSTRRGPVLWYGWWFPSGQELVMWKRLISLALIQIPLLPFGLIMFAGALRMRRLESYGLAMTASYLSALLGCLDLLICAAASSLGVQGIGWAIVLLPGLGIPVGIWCRHVLRTAGVKAAFTAGATPAQLVVTTLVAVLISLVGIGCAILLALRWSLLQS